MTARFQILAAVQVAVDWSFDKVSLGQATKVFRALDSYEARRAVPLSTVVFATLNNLALTLDVVRDPIDRAAVSEDHKAIIKATASLILGAVAPSADPRATYGKVIDLKRRAAGERDDGGDV